MTTLEKRHLRVTLGGTTECYMTIGAWMKMFDVSRRQAARDLKRLDELGYVDGSRVETFTGVGFIWSLLIYPPHP